MEVSHAPLVQLVSQSHRLRLCHDVHWELLVQYEVCPHGCVCAVQWSIGALTKFPLEINFSAEPIELGRILKSCTLTEGG